MARKYTRRGGASVGDYFRKALPGNWGKSVDQIASERKASACVKKREDLDKECGPAAAIAPATSEVATASAEMSGAPAAPPALGARRRRRVTRRKSYKGGKHRRSH